MFKNKKKVEIFEDEFILDKSVLDDDLFICTDVEGYDSCSGYNKQKCTTDCSFPIVVPTIVTLN